MSYELCSCLLKLGGHPCPMSYAPVYLSSMFWSYAPVYISWGDMFWSYAPVYLSWGDIHVL